MSKKNKYELQYIGEKIQELLDHINNKDIYGTASTTEDGLMSANDKKRVNAMERDIEELEKTTGVKVLKQSEYDALPEKRMDTIYATRNKYLIIHRIYLGTILIAKRNDASGNMCFPYTFPIIF